MQQLWHLITASKAEVVCELLQPFGGGGVNGQLSSCYLARVLFLL